MWLSASSHVVDSGDARRDSIFHPAAAIMPALFPVAKRENARGQDLVTSIAAGYEASEWLKRGALVP